MVINQGDIYWVDLPKPSDSEPGFRRPGVVIQNDAFNSSRIQTVVICLLTSNLNRAAAAGNVLLQSGEGGLSKQSVVNISQIYTVGKFNLHEKIGQLSQRRLFQVLQGVYSLLEP